MKTRHSIYISIGYALLMLIFFFHALSLEYWKTKLMPLLVSGIGFILAAMEIIKETRQRKQEVSGEIDRREQGRTERPWQRYLYEGGWLAGLFIGFYLLGFISFPLFIIAYLKIHGRRWRACFFFAAVMLMVSYSIFYFFDVLLPLGLIPSGFLS